MSVFDNDKFIWEEGDIKIVSKQEQSARNKKKESNKVTNKKYETLYGKYVLGVIEPNTKALYKIDKTGLSYYLNKKSMKWESKNSLAYDMSGAGGCTYEYYELTEKEAMKLVEEWEIDPNVLFDNK